MSRTALRATAAQCSPCPRCSDGVPRLEGGLVCWEGGFLRTARFRGPGLESAVRAKFPCRTLITKAINLIAALAGRGAGRWLIGFACIESGARKHLVAEAGKLLAAVDRGDKEAISQQVINTRKACSACHQLFRD